jgi:hypothetical protein
MKARACFCLKRYQEFPTAVGIWFLDTSNWDSSQHGYKERDAVFIVGKCMVRALKALKTFSEPSNSTSKHSLSQPGVDNAWRYDKFLIVVICTARHDALYLCPVLGTLTAGLFHYTGIEYETVYLCALIRIMAYTRTGGKRGWSKSP